MNENDLYSKLVDMYAGRELPPELEASMEAAAADDSDLRKEMTSMRKTVDILHEQPAPSMTEESYQRILLKMYSRGVELQLQTPDPYHLQYHLPING